ncbi:flagellar motor protein [Pseudoalteromonas spongiae]|uniref:flagellar motor protein n=1 Tax=Pseudoalteromonas spongiae TaxID=298657 RepID=UPI00026CD41F|nr:flagellar motor protein [Pseudoalteromonas spongiae]ATC98213.1 chemotaxis protein MotA [Pseudoalteromonas spongiae UST010723-006]
MDKLAVFGAIIAFVAIGLGYTIEGGVLANLFDLSAFIIVFGGTLGAVMLQATKYQFTTAIKMLPWVITPPKHDFAKGIEQVKNWAAKVRHDGYLSLENLAIDEKDNFVSKGLNLLVDGSDEQQFFDTMENEILQRRNALNESSQVYHAMGGYSPTLGILGAVLGLIQAMNFIQQPDMLGAGIATAFVATIYGVGFANLLYIPIANKLAYLVDEHCRYHQMLAEGMFCILQGDTPNAIEQKLSAYLIEKNNKSLFR